MQKNLTEIKTANSSHLEQLSGSVERVAFHKVDIQRNGALHVQ